MAKILVIDDDKELRNILAEVLTMDGHAVTAAEDGFSGIEKYRSQSPELVITDLSMPRVDGLEVLKSLAADFANVPIIVITGSSDIETMKEVLSLNANRILRKPFEADMLLDAVGLLTGTIDPTEE